jgi:DNA-binding transcriptional MerR regulator/uncharacterized protein YbjT (DUF2867 family)
MRASLSIGDFARASHLSVTTLRHYHELGLLIPANNDPGSGYRRYTTEQIPTAQVIRRFRDLEMPLDQIRAVLDAPDLRTRNDLIAGHFARLERELAHTQAVVASLRDLLHGTPRASQIGYRSEGAIQVAVISGAIKLGDGLGWFQGAMGELYVTLAAQRVPPAGPAGSVIFSGLYHENYYAAFLRDPDENNIEVVTHGSAEQGRGDARRNGIGATGGVRGLITAQLLDAGRKVVAVVRDQRRGEPLQRAGATVIVHDLLRVDPPLLAHQLSGSSAVVFAAGVGYGAPLEQLLGVDREGAIAAGQAARTAGVPRFLQVSAIGVESGLPVGFESGWWTAYYAAKRVADETLRSTDLDWTILRPGQLTDAPPTGRILLGDSLPLHQIPRSDIAMLAITVLDEPASIGRAWEVTSGSTPIIKAVASAIGRSPAIGENSVDQVTPS